MKNYIQSTKTYRYFTLGNPEKAKKILFVLHGYGQLPEYFIQKFNHFEDDYFIVAPEGLHRFYLKGSSGRVGASWMTKEERFCDIEDNLNFLAQLYSEITVGFEASQISILGFSQGAATAARWFYSKEHLAGQFIIWASVFPPDLRMDQEITASTAVEKVFVLGTQDEYFTEDDQKNVLSFYQSCGFETIVFDGKHDIDVPTLTRLLS